MSSNYATPYTSAPLPPAPQPHSHQQVLAQQDAVMRQQDQSLAQLGFHVSVGIAANKPLAKLASRHAKPPRPCGEVVGILSRSVRSHARLKGAAAAPCAWR